MMTKQLALLADLPNSQQKPGSNYRIGENDTFRHSFAGRLILGE
jgi:hypothetical protein